MFVVLFLYAYFGKLKRWAIISWNCSKSHFIFKAS
jgi:hypothetical protein